MTAEPAHVELDEEWPHHDRDHLQQILEILTVRQLGPMTPVMRSALTDA